MQVSSPLKSIVNLSESNYPFLSYLFPLSRFFSCVFYFLQLDGFYFFPPKCHISPASLSSFVESHNYLRIVLRVILPPIVVGNETKVSNSGPLSPFSY